MLVSSFVGRKRSCMAWQLTPYNARPLLSRTFSDGVQPGGFHLNCITIPMGLHDIHPGGNKMQSQRCIAFGRQSSARLILHQ